MKNRSNSKTHKL